MRLHQLDIPIGQELKLNIIGLDYKNHTFSVELVGYHKGKSVVLALLSKPGQVLLHKGLKASVMGELPDGSFSFESEVEAVEGEPYLHIHLEYPVSVEYKKAREYIRIKVDTPVEVNAQTGLGMTTSTISGYMLDVSYGGARLVLEKELTAMVTKLEVGVMLSTEGLERDMTLIGEVRNKAALSEDHPDCGFAYGVEFTEVKPDDDVFLRCFCLQQQMQGRIVSCD